MSVLRRLPPLLSASRVDAASAAVVHRLPSHLILAFVLAELFILYTPTIRWLLDRWTMSVWHHIHGLFIPPLVAFFVYRELRRDRSPRASSAWGFAILLPALGLHVLDVGIHTQLLSAVSLVIALPGLSLLFLGVQRTKKILLPLGFSAFMLPIPAGLIEPLHLGLRRIASEATASIVAALGIPIFVEGTTLSVPNATLEVSDACSGFSTLYAASALACLTAYASPSSRRRGAVLLLAVPLAIVANIARVTLLVLAVWWKGNGVLETVLHPSSGVLAFGVVMVVLTWLGRPPGVALKSTT
jgi:exosortase